MTHAACVKVFSEDIRDADTQTASVFTSSHFQFVDKKQSGKRVSIQTKRDKLKLKQILIFHWVFHSLRFNWSFLSSHFTLFFCSYTTASSSQGQGHSMQSNKQSFPHEL